MLQFACNSNHRYTNRFEKLEEGVYIKKILMIYKIYHMKWFFPHPTPPPFFCLENVRIGNQYAAVLNVTRIWKETDAGRIERGRGGTSIIKVYTDVRLEWEILFRPIQYINGYLFFTLKIYNVFLPFEKLY